MTRYILDKNFCIPSWQADLKFATVATFFSEKMAISSFQVCLDRRNFATQQKSESFYAAEGEAAEFLRERTKLAASLFFSFFASCRNARKYLLLPQQLLLFLKKWTYSVLKDDSFEIEEIVGWNTNKSFFSYENFKHLFLLSGSTFTSSSQVVTDCKSEILLKAENLVIAADFSIFSGFLVRRLVWQPKKPDPNFPSNPSELKVGLKLSFFLHFTFNPQLSPESFPSSFPFSFSSQLRFFISFFF